MTRLLTGIILTLGVGLAQANPTGLWKTIDEKTEQATGIIRITEHDGALYGEIVEVLDPTAQPGAVCNLCTDERKGAPIVGLTVIRNVATNGDSDGPWDGGDILDPKDGKVYSVRLSLADQGRKLEVRGYIGAPMFGRTQVWHRVE